MFGTMTVPEEQPRWRRRPGERPAQILDAALAEFGEKGLAGARLEDIAERAGIAKGTVYLYFENKHELFSEVLREWFREVLEQVQEAPPGAEAEGALRDFARRYWALLRSPRFATIQRLVTTEIQAFPELAHEYGRTVRLPVERFVQGLLQRGTKAGHLDRGDDAVRARMLLALLLQHALWCTRREFNPSLSQRSDEQVFTDVIEFFLGAVRVRPLRPAGAGP